MRWNGLLYLATIVLTPASSLFVDEAFNIDFHHALLGLPQPHSTFFHKPDKSSNAALIYALSNKSLLGAINPRDGSLIWRQSIAGHPIETENHSFLVAGEGDGKVTTAVANEVAAWDAADGRLVWRHVIREQSRVVDLQAIPVLGSSTDGAVQDVVVLTQPTIKGGAFTVTRLGGDGTGGRWHYSDSDAKPDSNVGIAASPKHVYYIVRSAGLLSGQKTKVVVLDIITGKQVKELSLNLDDETLAASGKLVAASGSEAPFLVTSQKPYTSLKLNILGTNKVSTIVLEDKGEEIVSVTVHTPIGVTAEPHFLVHLHSASRNWAEVFHLNVASGEAKRAYSLPAIKEASTFAASNNGQKVFFTRASASEIAVFSSESHGHLARWQRKPLGGGHSTSLDPMRAIAEVASKDASSTAVRVVVTSAEGSLYLVRNGETQWVRPEMAAYAQEAAWHEHVNGDALSQELGNEVSVDPATAYINRVYRHAQELMHLPNYLLQLPQKLLSPSSESLSVREDLLGSRSLVLATNLGQVLSFSGTTGNLQWHTKLPQALPADAHVISLAVAGGRATLYTSDGSITVLNATDGELVETKTGTTEAAAIIELPGSPASTILKVNEHGVPSISADLAPSVPNEGNVVMTADRSGHVSGWTVGTTAHKTWTFAPVGEKVVAITSRAKHDPIASIGRVLGDRSVLYKYFTPNVALLTARSSEGITMYLIDAVTGTVLHSTFHANVLATMPVSAVLSENWFAYSFTSSNPETLELSSRLVISELFESNVPNDRGQLSSKTNYSSFSADGVTKPHVISAAYLLAEPISHLTVTQTAQGISSRSVLAYLPNSKAIASIPRHILDARRPMDRDPTAYEAEEGLFRYSPELMLDPKHFLSHSREVIGIKHISTVPTLLESTSTASGYGHDIFGTQVAPSQTFDVLGKNFNRVQLVLTVIALYLGVLGLRPLVRRNVVKRGWM